MCDFVLKLLNVRIRARVWCSDKMATSQIPVRRALIARGFRGWSSSCVIFPKILCDVTGVPGTSAKIQLIASEWARCVIHVFALQRVVTKDFVAPRTRRDVSAFVSRHELCAKMASFVVRNAFRGTACFDFPSKCQSCVDNVRLSGNNEQLTVAERSVADPVLREKSRYLIHTRRYLLACGFEEIASGTWQYPLIWRLSAKNVVCLQLRHCHRGLCRHKMQILWTALRVRRR